MLPFYATVSDFIDRSLMGKRLGGAFDINFLFELLRNNPGFGKTTLIMAFSGFMVYSLANLFLSGGAFATFAGSGRYSPHEFWGAAAAYFGRFTRLVMWSVPLVIAFFLVQFLVKELQDLIFGSDAYEYITYWGNWFRLALRGIFLMIFFLIIDFGRIYTILTGETVMRNAIWQGARFTFKNFRRAFTLGFTVFLIGVIGLMIYNPVANFFNAPNGLIVALLFIWQQLFIMFRMMLRLSLYSGEIYLYKGLNGEVLPLIAEKEIEAEPVKESKESEEGLSA